MDYFVSIDGSSLKFIPPLRPFSKENFLKGMQPFASPFLVFPAFTILKIVLAIQAITAVFKEPKFVNFNVA